MQLFENYSLKDKNTFGLEAHARYFAQCTSTLEVVYLLKEMKGASHKVYVLGGGSNVIFNGDFDGLVIHPAIHGIEKMKESDDFCYVRVGAGEDWDSFVAWAVKQNLGGIENLSAIPGTVGASPIQNIGAYGVEVKDVLECVEGLHLDSLKTGSFSNTECGFGYRDSIFKHRLKSVFLVSHVTYKLRKQPVLHTSYGDVEAELDLIGERNIASVRQAITAIRGRKLPDPKQFGNAGSFFKNPVISREQALNLQQQYANLKLYDAGERLSKIPAAWLIEQSGWKGRRVGNVGSYPSQPLVIVNYGGACAPEIIEFAHMVQDSVYEQFKIHLEMEVNVVG